MKLAKTVAALVVVMAAAPHAQGPTKVLGFSDAGKAALIQQMSAAVTRGDAPGIAEIVVSRDGVLFEGSAGKLDVARGTAMPTNAIFSIASISSACRLPSAS